MAISQARLRELLHYNPNTGHFIWRVQQNGRVPAGARAGTIKKDGRRDIKIDGKLYRAGRLAFLYMTGRLPPADTDHMDCDPDNNRWSNLREATRRQNTHNSRRHRNKIKDTSKGVSWHKGIGKYTARITVNGKTISLGAYRTEAMAAGAYARAAALYFGQFAREK